MNADGEESGGGGRGTTNPGGRTNQQPLPDPDRIGQQPSSRERTVEANSAEQVDPDDQEDDEVLEESPCRRWSKRREKVKQRDVPGIDAAYLAMDNETGNEVVWNEVLFSERKNFREQEEKIRAVFDNLIRLEHPNLVKFHKYWMDTKSDKPRIIFITEYMSSGSMSRFLQRARSSGSLLNIKAWKSWTRQILSALSYLHSCDPPIVHANLNCNTVFIQQNGLVKIGCVAPKTIHHHVKTFRENIKNVHYLAPEYDQQTMATTQADIYSFGVCALEMATTGALQSGCLNGGGASTSCNVEREKSGESGTGGGGGGGFHMVTEEMVHKAVNTLEDTEQKEFIQRCLEHDPNQRANVTELLDRLGPPEPDKNDETSLDEDGFEPEQRQKTPTDLPLSVGSASRTTSPPGDGIPSPIQNSMQQHQQTLINASSIPSIQTKTATTHASNTITSAQNQDGSSTHHHHHFIVSTSSVPAANAGPLTKPTTAITTQQPLDASSSLPAPSGPTIPNNPVAVLHANAPDEGYHTNQSIVDGPSMGKGQAGESGVGRAETIGATGGNGVPMPQHRESRQIMQLHAELLEPGSDGVATKLRIQLQLDDQMNRQLTTALKEEDSGESLVQELVQHGFVSEINSASVCELLTKVLHERYLQQSAKMDNHKEETAPMNASSETGHNSQLTRQPSQQHQKDGAGKQRRAS